MLDGAVFSCGVHGLQNQQDAPAILGIEFFLQPGETRNPPIERFFRRIRHAQGDLTDANNLHGAKFVYELTQNLYFVGAVLTYLLWFAVLKLHQMHTRVVQIILALGVYFSAFAASYAFAGISPYSWLWRGVCYVAALWLPIAWGYAFLKVPAEAKLMTAQIAPGHS